MRFLIFSLLLLIISNASAQVVPDTLLIPQADTALLTTNPAFARDTVLPGEKAFSPKKATIRSAILPGWGQAYTKRYLMIPVVYAALGVPAGFFIFNNTWYKRSKLAYEIKIDKDTARFPEIHPDIVDLSPESLRFYRNDFRRNRDYSVLFFVLAWGLNVVDATVFAHLKQFDVTDDLSMKIKPTFDLKTTGISLVLTPKDGHKQRVLTSR